jgi:hypothetical protein
VEIANGKLAFKNLAGIREMTAMKWNLSGKAA